MSARVLVGKEASPMSVITETATIAEIGAIVCEALKRLGIDAGSLLIPSNSARLCYLSCSWKDLPWSDTFRSEIRSPAKNNE